jgi:hypothetical protein
VQDRGIIRPKSHTCAYALHPILRDIYDLADGCEEKVETQNEATKRARTEPIAQGNECHVRQPEQEQHMTIGDTQASAEDSDNVDFVPPVLPALAVPAIIHERAPLSQERRHFTYMMLQ